MRVNFDYNASTPLASEAIEAVVQTTREVFGNASSVHHFGQQAKAVMDEARSAIASLINADPSEVVFTSGGTESDNFAIRGAAEALEPTGRRHLIASAIEHEAVLNTLRALARRGWRTTLLPLDEEAILSTAAKTGKVIVLHEATRTGGPGGEVAAVISERAFEYLDAPVVRMAPPDTPVPYSPPLEEYFLPNAEKVGKAIRALYEY